MDIKSLLDSIGDIDNYRGTLFLSTFKGKVLISTICILTFVIFLSLIIFIYGRSFKKLAPWDRAKLELDRAYFEFCNGQKELRELYFDLTSIIKLVITDHLKIDVLGKTDREVIKKIRDSNIDKNLLFSIEELFYRAQSVKFASQDQVKNQILSDITITRTLLEGWALKNKQKRGEK